MRFCKLQKLGAGDRQTGASNIVTNGYALSLNSRSITNLTFDANGNMTQDQAGNTFSWDCEKRLIKITYPGSGNYSAFAYDGLGRNVLIQEYTSSSLTTTRQMVWSWLNWCEERDSAGSVTKQICGRGELISGNKYFWSTDKLASVSEMCDNSGNLVAQYSYDPFGRMRVLQESEASDLGFSGCTRHSISGLWLTPFRAYQPYCGRWLSPDPAGLSHGTNLYFYCYNSPTQISDPSGLGEPWWGKDCRKYWGWTPDSGYVWPSYTETDYRTYVLCAQTNESATKLRFIRNAAFATLFGINVATFLNPSGPASGSKYLYRAVELQERDQILQTGTFINIQGLETKYFSTCASGACQFAKMANTAWGTEFWIVRTLAPEAFATSFGTVDSGIPTVVITTEQLTKLVPEILNYCPF